MAKPQPVQNKPAKPPARKILQGPQLASSNTSIASEGDPRIEPVMEVIALIESGMSEHAACERLGMARSTFRHRALRIGAVDAYARATVALAQDQVSKIEDVIEDMRTGLVDATVGRIEIDARRWLASKMMPKQYGEKLQTELTGANGGPVQVAAVDWKGLTPADLEAMASAARKALGGS